MRKISKLVDELDHTDRGWENLFREIKIKSSEVRLSNKDAHLPENRRRNRYRNVSPYDHSRVKLIEGDNDYMNASLVKVPNLSRRYIIAQGPLQETTGQFWQMIWEQNSKAIIMLNKVIENRMEKCFQYWPLDEEDTMEFEDEGYKIEVSKTETRPTFTLRDLKLSNLKNETSRNIYHFHYTTWPDFGVPDSPNEFLEFLSEVRSLGVLNDEVGPAILHCSAGIGRSGTFALVDACLMMAENHIPFDATKILLAMRNDRMGLIQTYQQLRFSYLAIAEGSEDFGQEEELVREPIAEEEDEDESSSSESESEDEKAPVEDLANGDDGTNSRKRHAEDQSDESHEAKKGKETQSDPVDSISNNNFESENKLRQRQKNEKQKELEQKVNDIKSKMQDQEKKKNSKSKNWMPYVMGGISVVAIILAVKYYCY